MVTAGYCCGCCVVKFVLSTLAYIADVVATNGGSQENGTLEGDSNSVSNGECLDDDMQELMDKDGQQVCVYLMI